jgi:hypothetical protein
MEIYKMNGNNGQYDPLLTGLRQPEPSHARDDWKPIPRTPFHEGGLGAMTASAACWKW